MRKFKFKPMQHVKIKILEDTPGRVTRCILEGGPLPIYVVHYIASSEGKCLEFYEDELEAM